MNTFFSIIIPTYNRAHLIQETIRTVFDQTYTDYELIIIDDGSTDNTEEIIKALMLKYDDKIKYVKQNNRERAAARNTGLKVSKGSYMLFFDSDDTLYNNHLQVAKHYIENNNSPEFMHLRYDIKNADGKVVNEGPAFYDFPNKKLISGNFLSCNGVFLRRDIALENQFNEDRLLSAMEDWELWLRLASKYNLHYINTITSSIINHEARSVVVTNKEALINRIEIIIKYIINNKNVVNYYKKDISKFTSSCYSYVSLHLALTGKYKKETLKYLIKSFQFPGSLFQKRFYAIVKRLI